MNKEKTAVEWLYNNLLLNPISNEDIEYNEAVFENAKVLDAQQQGYSEEEVLDILKELEIECVINPRRTEIREWFEQFKKK
jgi:hypothetical protein